MKQTELEAIAREYAESTAIDVEEFLLTEHGAFHAFKWLSERYEIVSKEKVKAEYSKALECNKIAHPLYQIEGCANRCLLESLFPQTLKSEENGNSDN